MTPWTIARQAPLSMVFSRQEYWSGFHALLQGIFLTQGSGNVSSIVRWALSHQGRLAFMMLRYVPSIPTFWVEYPWLLFFPFYQFQYTASPLFSLQSFCWKGSGQSYESSLVCNLWIFLAAFSILFLSFLFAILMTACLDVFLFGFIIFETPFVSWTWMSVSFPRLRRFSAISFSRISSAPFSLFSFYDPWNANARRKDLLNCPHFISPFVLVFCSGAVISVSPTSGSPVHSSVSFGQLLIPSRAGFTSLQDLRPDNPRWSKCNHNRNKGHNNCNVLKSYLLPKSMETLPCTKQVPGAKKAGDCCSRVFFISVIVLYSSSLVLLFFVFPESQSVSCSFATDPSWPREL